MEAHAISNGYMTGKVYIIWEIPHDDISGYEIDRNGVTIASSLTEDEEGKAKFVSPTMFDHDHHTNLFKKDSTKQLMFVDENVYPYQHYEYQIIAKRINDIGEVMEQIESDFIYVQAQ